MIDAAPSLGYHRAQGDKAMLSISEAARAMGRVKTDAEAQRLMILWQQAEYLCRRAMTRKEHEQADRQATLAMRAYMTYKRRTLSCVPINCKEKLLDYRAY